MHWKYLKAVLRHKKFVLLAGWGSVPLWRLLIHDWSKFTPTEWFPYARAFYGSGGGKTGKPQGDPAFDRAWLHHQKFNLHHWQYWIMHEDSGKVFCLPMPMIYLAEMVADWRGANRAYGDTPLLEWYEKTKAGRMLHPETRALVEERLGIICCPTCGMNQEPCLCEVQ
jgi:hypothetical protein